MSKILLSVVFLFFGYMLRTFQVKEKSEKLSLFFILYFSSTRNTRGKVHRTMPFDKTDLDTENLVTNLNRFVENGLDDAIKIMENEA